MGRIWRITRVLSPGTKEEEKELICAMAEAFVQGEGELPAVMKQVGARIDWQESTLGERKDDKGAGGNLRSGEPG